MKIVIAAEFEYLREWLSSICLQEVDTDDTLHNGRNKIMLCTSPLGEKFAVKKYKRHDLIKRIAYTFFKHNKAKRAYENARELRGRGFETPQEIAYVEEYRFGFVTQVYYVCAYTSCCAIRSELIDCESFDEGLATAYARYVVSLHKAGVLHRDLNPTNVLYKKSPDGYEFELIDINRMCFYDSEVPKAESMENLTLFWWLSDVYKYILNVYAAHRGWSADDVCKAVRIKQSHDRNWVRRKRFTGWLKKYILRK